MNSEQPPPTKKPRRGARGRVEGDGAVAQGKAATALGRGARQAGRDIYEVKHEVKIFLPQATPDDAAAGTQIIYAEKGANVVIGDAPVPMSAVDRQSALGRYLQHLISQNRYLQLQGIRSGGKLVNIELDRIYVTLRATRQHAQRQEIDWLSEEAALAPGERQRAGARSAAGGTPGEEARETEQISVNQALAKHRRLVVLGDPGCGKTTLLRYLTLLYARDLAEGTRQVADRLALAEDDVLPIFLPLRQIGCYLAEHRPRDDGTEGHAIVLEFLRELLSICPEITCTTYTSRRRSRHE